MTENTRFPEREREREREIDVCTHSDYLSDDEQNVTTESTSLRRFIPEICLIHFVFAVEIVCFKIMEDFFLGFNPKFLNEEQNVRPSRR